MEVITDFNNNMEDKKIEIQMLPYNTDMPVLELPEYGRNIRNLVDFCLTLEDREERTRCAYAIVDVMARLFPAGKGEGGDRRKFWDHLNIMSGFSLDIDFPCEVVTKEQMRVRPERLPYSSGDVSHRHYGRTVERLVNTVANMQEGPERDQLILMVANHMKKLMMITNPEGATDQRILNDLYEFSQGKIALTPETIHLQEYMEIARPVAKRNNRRRKK